MDGWTVLLDTAQQVCSIRTPEKAPPSPPPQGKVMVQFWHITHLACGGEMRKNKHLGALKLFVPLLILSISSENHQCRRPRKAEETQSKAHFLVFFLQPTSCLLKFSLSAFFPQHSLVLKQAQCSKHKWGWVCGIASDLCVPQQQDQLPAPSTTGDTGWGCQQDPGHVLGSRDLKQGKNTAGGKNVF